MTPERWRQINDLFHATLERTTDREDFLVRATVSDPELRREVQSLLAAHQTHTDFLETPAWGVAPELMFDSPAHPGGAIGPYRIVEEIGRGGMGVVYAATDERLGRQVAIKALAPGYVQDPAGRERLRREARAAAALSHPSIATVYALEELDGDLYIVSELVRGQTLRDELARGPLPPDRLRATLIEIADALAAAHASGIVHRDLKPENIMRTPDGRVKVLDFGLAREVRPDGAPTATQLTAGGAAVGTPGYMAPEQLSGGAVDARTDIFAFGVLASELATGQHPFGPDSAAMLRRLAQLMEGRALSGGQPWSAPDLEAVARRCMRADPGERYASGADLASALRGRVTGETPVHAPSADAFWWWQFHQCAIAVVLAAIAATAWVMRPALGRPLGSWIFFASLALATVSIAARLNLVFTSRVHPANLAEQRRRAFPWVSVMDGLLSSLMVVAAVRSAGDHDAAAGLSISLATIVVVSLIFIEPATTRSAGIPGKR